MIGESFVSVRGLSKSFKQRALFGGVRGTVEAVREVDLDIPENCVMGLVGESGSGKTTLSRALLYLDPPTSGRVRVAGIDPSEGGAEGRRALRAVAQIVFQDPHSALNPRLTVEQSIGEALAARGMPRRKRRSRVAELLHLTGIPARMMKRRPPDFSGGQKQRIVIARALATEPRFLVLDEPVSSLDVSIQAQIINLLLELKERLKLTYLFVSHDLNLVSYISDRVAVMSEGRIVEVADATEILTSPKSDESRRLFERAPVFHDRRLDPQGGM